MSDPNIVLVGFMGSGKSVTARRLADRLGREAVSTDALIEAREGRSITTIFSQKGEPYFRNIEKAVVAEVSRRTAVIVDCGGGVVLNPENLRCLQASGRVFYLKASPEALYRHVQGKLHRPLLNVPDPLAMIRQTLAERQTLYEQAGETIVSEGRSVDDMANEILARMGLASGGKRTD